MQNENEQDALNRVDDDPCTEPDFLDLLARAVVRELKRSSQGEQVDSTVTLNVFLSDTSE